MVKTFAPIVLVFAFGCGPSRGGGDGDAAIAHLELAPADAMITITDGVPQAQAYTATLVGVDGSHKDVTSQVVFTVSVPEAGAWSGPTLTVSGGAAGPTRVVATDGEVTGDTGLTIYVNGSRDDGSVPANAGDLFTSATETAGRAPTIAYPADGILVPPNLGEFDVHWTDTTNDLFEISLQNQYVNLRIYKQGAAPSYTAYTPGEWFALASPREELTLTIAGLNTTNPTQKGTSAPQHVEVTNEVVQGGVYYWTTTAPQGIFRYDMSTPGTPPSSFFPPNMAPGSPNNCVGCHTLSRDGTKIAMTIDGGDGRGTVFNVADRSVLVPFVTNPQRWNFATFTPDASKLVTVSHGVMVLRSTAGGATIGSALVNSTGTVATHPELSPDGTQLASVETTQGGTDYDVSTGSIVVRTYDDTSSSFGPTKVLVPNATGAANFYPSWSPDGQWLLFTRTTGRSYDDTSAEVWVLKADGSLPPIQLLTADTGQVDPTNSWARWAPFQQSFGATNDPVFYITFSSRRQFGVRPLTTGSYGTDIQIWMAPFYPTRAAAGQDPSGPAFRMPFQDFTTSNHIAQWTQAVVIGRKGDGTPLTQAEAARAK